MKMNQWVNALVLVSLPLFSNAAVPEWQIIPAQSNLEFSATQNGAPVKGQFKRYTGHIAFDQNDLKHSKADVIIDISSVSTSYAELTSTLLTPDWFNAKLFPKAEFKSTEFSKTGDNTYQAAGTLTIRDKTAPVILTFTATEPSKMMITVEGSTHFNRSTFGVGQGEWSSTDAIKDDVTVHFKLVAKTAP